MRTESNKTQSEKIHPIALKLYRPIPDSTATWTTVSNFRKNYAYEAELSSISCGWLTAEARCDALYFDSVDMVGSG